HDEQQPEPTAPEPPEPTAPEPPSEQKGKAPKEPWQKAALGYLHDFVFLLAGIVVVFLLLFRVVVVSGTSMNDTLYNGDYLLLVGNLFYTDPQPGDIIVASKQSFENGTPIVKRVIATENQVVDIDFEAGIVYVDGVALDEPYVKELTYLQEGQSFPQVVQPGCVFVMGDNRNDSRDSRSTQIGQIDTREILGKVVFLFFPGTNTAADPRDWDFSRIGLVD
ncbi:MAG: signal peptidase I, partial [Firmicutes bacterium]|nr:signal peptidase I [Bacillota bacterium]